MSVRRADPDDAPQIGRLLHDFNTEFGDPTPGPQALAERVGELMASGDTEVVLAGEPPCGLALLRFRRSLWTPRLECYLAELYVEPGRRGRGLGRALMESVLELARERGADYIELNTEETDVAARALYESLGFRCGEGEAASLYYEREL